MSDTSISNFGDETAQPVSREWTILDVERIQGPGGAGVAVLGGVH